ncbi:hypothetical protein [Neobacillus sp. YIM B06451]|uniref:hypothetical protein n=1 Tax=Neobacillus sp. YIM B06451 TaxID=3070994 RepID=UPI00292DEA32|nr:hypothetical protein [Neobacillus sp. YIM B06451]
MEGLYGFFVAEIRPGVYYRDATNENLEFETTELSNALVFEENEIISENLLLEELKYTTGLNLGEKVKFPKV